MGSSKPFEHTQQKMNKLFRTDENRIEQCLSTANIAHSVVASNIGQ